MLKCAGFVRGTFLTKPAVTYEILTRVPHLRSLAETAANHHEKLDGSGYHRGVGGENFDCPSRILAVADIYDTLAQPRPYRDATPMEKVLSILKKESGEKLCPASVETMAGVIESGDLDRPAPASPAPRASGTPPGSSKPR